ncbi:MAG: hypothetical protein JWM28_878 [Chitinophagaceae bacterium]|nr:hypothetical protein [Chitinophagaceae bacterium]
MKRTSLIILLIIYVASYFNIVFSQDAASDFKKLDWIAGTWKRTNAKEGQNGYERWTKLSDTEWQGIGIIMQGRDTSLVEKLKIFVKNKHLYYIADISGNPEPVWYRFTEITENGFACENLEYDFPKRIEYRQQGNKIKATVSGDGKFIDYLFRKQKK